MSNILYYPHINLPKTDWAIRALLYYDKIATIVPNQYFRYPEQYDPFMREAIKNDLIEPIDPMNILSNPWSISEEFIKYLNKNVVSVKKRGSRFVKNDYDLRGLPCNDLTGIQLHSEKFNSDIFDYLLGLGLAQKMKGNWYHVEKRTADELMNLLASVIANKINYQPATDSVNYSFSSSYMKNEDVELRTRQCMRDVILKNLTPYPEQIDLTKLRRFKDKHHELLDSFNRKVELLTLTPMITPESLFLTASIEDMKSSKDELYARMNESKLGNILFGSICGTIAASASLIDNNSVAVIPSLLNAIYSACQVERAENVIDQTGLKYLALIDKRLRRCNL